jgi:hypothetical protein
MIIMPGFLFRMPATTVLRCTIHPLSVQHQVNSAVDYSRIGHIEFLGAERDYPHRQADGRHHPCDPAAPAF